MTVEIGGVANTASGLNWAEGEVVDLYVAAGAGMPTVARERANGGLFSALAIVGSWSASVPATGPIVLLCAGTSSEWKSWIRSMTAFRSGVVPF